MKTTFIFIIGALSGFGQSATAATQPNPPAIVFISDFGNFDDSASQCKAAMLEIAPEARIIDMTHEIPPFDIRLASFLLYSSAQIWPRGTVFLAVVDPGVGTARKSIAVETLSGHVFVGPDNGLFTLPILHFGLKKARSIENPKFMRDKVSRTFNGRDLYSPAAAHLCKDTASFDAIGPEISSPVMLDWQKPVLRDDYMSGSVLYVERPYGNVWTDIDEYALGKAGLVAGTTLQVEIAGKRLALPLAKTFGDVPEGLPLAYLNSRGLVSFALNMRDFAASYRVKSGDPVKIIFSTGDLIDVAAISGENIFFDIRYATPNNFTGRKIYPSERCLLRRAAAKALVAAGKASVVSDRPFSLCVLDCYRPLSVQKIFWGIMPDERYVANPAKGPAQNRGMAVDVTACDFRGQELEMPSKHDDFSERAGRGYKGAAGKALEHREDLERIMQAAGFIPFETEWWRFDYYGWEKAEIMDVPLE